MQNIRERHLQILEDNKKDIFKIEITDKKKEDIQKQLDAAQEGQRSRILDTEDITWIIQDKSKLIKELSKYTNNFYYEYMEGDFKKGYSYNGSGFIATFTTVGDLKEITIKRNKNRGINRLVVDLEGHTELEKKLLRKMFNISSSGTILL